MKYSKTAQNIWNCADQQGNLYKLSLLTQVVIILENKKTKKKNHSIVIIRTIIA